MSNGRHVVKIYTTAARGQQLFQLSFYRAGRRERQTFADLSRAKQGARAVLCQLASLVAEAQRVVSVPEVEALVAARATLAGAGLELPLHLAVEGLADAVRQLGAPQAPLAALQRAVAFYLKHNPVGATRLSFAQLVQRYVASRKRIGVSAMWLETITYACEKFMQWFAGKEGLPAGAEVVARLDATYINAITKNNKLRILKALATWAVREKLAGLETITAVDFWKEAARDVEIYTPQEMCNMMHYISKNAAGAVPFVAIGAFAGLRAAEVLKLDWKEVLLERGRIMVAAEKAKTAARRFVPIAENLRAWLEPYAKASGPVVEWGRQWLGQKMRAGRLPCKRNGLRHSYVSYRLALVADAPRVALECGNSPAVIFKHYRELVSEEAAKEWFGIMPDPKA